MCANTMSASSVSQNSKNAFLRSSASLDAVATGFFLAAALLLPKKRDMFIVMLGSGRRIPSSAVH
jgi:hypothetical protein